MPLVPSTGLAKEDDVSSWKHPFVWKGSGRHTKVKRNHRPAAIGIVVICTLAAAMLFAAFQSSAPADSKQATAKQATTKPTAKQASARSDARPAARTAASAPAEKPEAQAAVVESTSVTITGCLERNAETFRLKDTSGTDAPRSRSWKSAFLKKGNASIDVVDSTNRLKMDDYVGQRVSLTGTLVDREMQARRVQRIATSCDKAL